MVAVVRIILERKHHPPAPRAGGLQLQRAEASRDPVSAGLRLSKPAPSPCHPAAIQPLCPPRSKRGSVPGVSSPCSSGTAGADERSLTLGRDSQTLTATAHRGSSRSASCSRLSPEETF